MKRKLSIITGLVVAILGFGVFANGHIISNNTDIISAVTSAPPAKTKPTTSITATEKINTTQAQLPACTNTLDIIKNPNNYLNKRINIVARFDKFATLGLDYKPAYRSSEKYISFLIMRSDTTNNIPLSEMKLFLKRTTAEKLIDLKEGDRVRFSGTVFSTALGDPWVDVETLEKIK